MIHSAIQSKQGILYIRIEKKKTNMNRYLENKLKPINGLSPLACSI